MTETLTNLVANTTDFQGLDGKTYRLSALGLAELGEYTNWFKLSKYRQAKLAGLSAEECRSIFDECWNLKIDFTSKEVNESMQSPEGLHRLLYLCLRKSDPNFKESDVSNVADFNNFDSIVTSLLALSGLKNTQDEMDKEDKEILKKS